MLSRRRADSKFRRADDWGGAHGQDKRGPIDRCRTREPRQTPATPPGALLAPVSEPRRDVHWIPVLRARRPAFAREPAPPEQPPRSLPLAKAAQTAPEIPPAPRSPPVSPNRVSRPPPHPIRCPSSGGSRAFGRLEPSHKRQETAETMIVAVTGGRDFRDAQTVHIVLTVVYRKVSIDLLIEGGAPGPTRSAASGPRPAASPSRRSPRTGPNTAGPPVLSATGRFSTASRVSLWSSPAARRRRTLRASPQSVTFWFSAGLAIRLLRLPARMERRSPADAFVGWRSGYCAPIGVQGATPGGGCKGVTPPCPPEALSSEDV
ncbi:hypothetical protein VT03_11690 [Planctomyces sp. SH-PL14]|nr:hypothetical protein VT03_11690 [Planctomyces sp. SH-PL14]